MRKTEFFEEIADIFEIEEDVNEATEIGIDSLAMLSIIALFDERFEMQVAGSDLSNVSSVLDLMNLAGMNKFE